MKHLLVKVCGMRQADNIRQVEQLRPDWMGFICWNGSKRFVEHAPAYLPLSCRRIGVFVNPSLDEIRRYTDLLGLTSVQLHGHESPDFCRKAGRLCGADGRPLPIIKAFGVESGCPLPDTAPWEEACRYFLFDTRCEGAGGSGRTFGWHVLEQYRGSRPFLLSGGIGPEQFGALQRFDHPMWAGIDLNSRFETEPGLKDVSRLQHFIEQIRKQENQTQP